MSKKKGVTPMVHEAQLIPIADISPSPVQSRKKFKNLDSLAASMTAAGLLQALVVRKIGELPSGRPGYELVSGERRLRAAKLLNWESIPAVVRELTDEQAYEITCVENLERDDLEPIEQARSVWLLLSSGRTIQEVADRLGRSSGWVARRSKLNDLSEKWQEQMDAETYIAAWPAACLELVARIAPKDQDAFLKVAKHYGARPTAEQIDRYLRDNYMRNLADAGFDTQTGTGFEGVSCKTCPTRTGAQPDLFDDQKPADDETPSELGRCLNLSCWLTKERITRDIQFKEAEAKYSGYELRTVSQGYYGKPTTAPWSKDIEKRRIKNEWEWSSCKRTEDGATPVLVVDGKDRGKIRWMKPSESARKREKIDDDRKARQDPIKVAEETRYRRLQGFVSDRIKELADDLPEISSIKLAAYIAVFSLDVNDNADALAWEQFDTLCKDHNLCHDRLVGAVISDIDNHSWKWNDSPEGLRRTCEFLGVDFEALEAKALEEVPVPAPPATTEADPEPSPGKKPAAKSRKGR